MINPISVTSIANNEKNIILAHQCPPVPCSCCECKNTSPSPSAAAVPRGSSMPSSSENHNTLVNSYSTLINAIFENV